ncbi:hypothetical protein AA313_de0210256 [Arthrobotrys entomopaga]|nr:hypothetical protein AA313_de0210256 [Arthrobotrys entomopaga]
MEEAILRKIGYKGEFYNFEIELPCNIPLEEYTESKARALKECLRMWNMMTKRKIPSVGPLERGGKKNESSGSEIVGLKLDSVRERCALTVTPQWVICRRVVNMENELPLSMRLPGMIKHVIVEDWRLAVEDFDYDEVTKEITMN